MRLPTLMGLGLASLAAVGTGAATDFARAPGTSAPAPAVGTDAACSVVIRWQTSASDLTVLGSKVRVRNLPWATLGGSWGGVPRVSLPEPYSDDPGNSLFFVNVELNQDCDRFRRYRFDLSGRAGTRFEGLSRELYYPREDGFTRETNIDLGYLDLCMADGHECDGPYYPADNRTPFPPGSTSDPTTRRQPLEGRPDSARSVGATPAVGGVSLNGDWVRTESNNHPNNGMRITLDEAGATLTVVPSTSSSSWSVGLRLWQDIRADGSVQVRGSDGNYYPALLTPRGEDRLDVEIERSGRGDNQSWVRAGPSIVGDWVRVAGAGQADDGLRIRVAGDAAAIRYLPALASRGLRTGASIFRDIQPSGRLEVRATDGSFQTAEAILVDENRLRIEIATGVIREEQLWVRPGAEEDVRAELEGPIDGPGAPGTDLTPTTDLPSMERPPATPPPGTLPGPACSDTSIPRDQMDIDWGWGMQSATNDDPLEETLGIREHMLPASGGPPRATDLVTDLERVRLPQMEDGFAYVWQPAGTRRLNTRRAVDLTDAELDARNQEARDGGLRPTDLEAYEVAGGTRYAGIWVENTEGVGWWAGHDLTADEFDEASGNLTGSGYRIVDIEAHAASDGVRFAAIWHQSCDNDNWRQLRGMDRDDYQMEVDSRAEDGFRVVDFESYDTDEGQRYAAVWQRVPAGRAWRVRSDGRLADFLNDHNRYTDEGHRLVDFESYATSAGDRYAGIWAENDPRYDYAFRAVLDTMVANYRTTHGLPGISVAVMHADSILYQRGFGWADSASGKWAHSGTIYLTASVAKAIAGTVAARLEERGEVDLTARTSDYLENLDADEHTHTVEQLLAKMGCVPHYAEASPSRPDTLQVYAYRADALEQMWADTLLGGCTPGMHYRYSTHGYTYVGAVLEGVTGKPVADILDDELIRPYGLASMRTVTSENGAGYGGLGVRPYDLAQGYRLTNGQSQAVDYENSTWKILGGGLQTDAVDLARFGALTLNGAIVADTARLWRDLTVGGSSWVDSISSIRPTGLGWVVSSQRPDNARGFSRAAAEHGGDGRGAGTLIRIYRDGDLVIAIMANQQLSSTRTDADGDPLGHPVESLATRMAGAVFRP